MLYPALSYSYEGDDAQLVSLTERVMVDTSSIGGLLIARLAGPEPKRVTRPSAANFFSHPLLSLRVPGHIPAPNYAL